jgi:hypothetical protein
MRFVGKRRGEKLEPNPAPASRSCPEDLHERVIAMVADIQVAHFDLPDALLRAFESAQGSDARLKIVEQYFEREEIALRKDGTLPLRANDPHEVYLVGSTSLIHIEREEAGAWSVVQPIQGRRGTVEKSVLENKIVGEMRKGRKLWLLSRNASRQSRPEGPQRDSALTSDRLKPVDGDDVPPSDVHPDDLVSDTSSPRLTAAEDVSRNEEPDLKAFSQLRTILQNVRLQFWNGNVRSQSTESIKVAIQKVEDHDVTGAIQAMEMLENVFVRLVEQWECDFREAERRVKRGRGEAGDLAKSKALKAHHLEMHSRIVQAKTQFRIMFNWLRDLETKMKRRAQGCQKP